MDRIATTSQLTMHGLGGTYCKYAWTRCQGTIHGLSQHFLGLGKRSRWNVEHIAEHGLDIEDVEYVLAEPSSESHSQSSGLPVVWVLHPMDEVPLWFMKKLIRTQYASLLPTKSPNRGIKLSWERNN